MTNSTLIESSYQVVSFSTGQSFPAKFLKNALPDAATAMFFAKVYKLQPHDVAKLMTEVLPGAVSDELFNDDGSHSHDLQDYELFLDEDGEWFMPDYTEGEDTKAEPVHAEILPEVWKAAELTIAKSIDEVAAKIGDTIAHMPGRTGEMVFQTLAQVNAQRPTIGQYKATIQHRQHVKRVLVVLDASGSMSERTVRTIVDDVVGMAYEANASFAVVSDNCTFWDAGAYSTRVVLEAAEYMGTRYETLAGLFDQDWDVVVTVADYDSSMAAKRALAACKGRIGEVLDISLVNRSTFLAECLGQLADKVQPLVVAQGSLTYSTW